MSRNASLDTGCGKYSYVISDPPSRDDSTQCNSPVSKHGFSVVDVDDATNRFCDLYAGGSPVPSGQSFRYGGAELKLKIASSADQDGCEMGEKKITQTQCRDFLRRAVNNCKCG